MWQLRVILLSTQAIGFFLFRAWNKPPKLESDRIVTFRFTPASSISRSTCNQYLLQRPGYDAKIMHQILSQLKTIPGNAV